jgi:hypothetical protein
MAAHTLSVDIDDKRFIATENEHGVSGADTISHYHIDGSPVTAAYAA